MLVSAPIPQAYSLPIKLANALGANVGLPTAALEEVAGGSGLFYSPTGPCHPGSIPEVPSTFIGDAERTLTPFVKCEILLHTNPQSDKESVVRVRNRITDLIIGSIEHPCFRTDRDWSPFSIRKIICHLNSIS